MSGHSDTSLGFVLQITLLFKKICHLNLFVHFAANFSITMHLSYELVS